MKKKILAVITAMVMTFASLPFAEMSVFAAEKNITMTEYFGTTDIPANNLSKHTGDRYYLKTKFGGGIKPNGKDGKGGKMNCTGFIIAVMKDCGGKVPKNFKGRVTSGYTLYNNLIDAGCMPDLKFSSIKKAKKSGKLRKGDVIWYMPKAYKVLKSGKIKFKRGLKDNHWAIYWGRGRHWASEKKGNTIVSMRAPDSKARVLVWHTTPLYGNLKLKVKAEDDATLTSGGYTLKGIKYKVYKSDKKTVVGNLVTDTKGITAKLKLETGTYYYRQTSTGESGYIKDNSWNKVVITKNKTKTGTTVNSSYYGKISINCDSDKTFTAVNEGNGKKYTAFDNLPAGVYTVSDGDTSMKVTVKYGKTVMVDWD